MNQLSQTTPAPVPCGRCRGLIAVAWRDRRRDLSFGRCGTCGRVRELDGHEYGRFVLAELQAGDYSPVRQVGLNISGGRVM